MSRMSAAKYNLTRFKGKLIAIDGPAGAGKSTTARKLAEQLGYVYLDTGAMYRALTWLALQKGIDPSDSQKLTALAEECPVSFKGADDGGQKVFIDSRDVTEAIRSPEVTARVSEVAAHPGVRKAMVVRQRQIGKKGSVVAEGRDTTTVVFPEADLKIYLDASIYERAQRRLLDMARLGVSTSLQEQEEEIRRRDEYDSGRKHSPLTKARDAILVNTTNMSIEQQVDHIVSLMRSLFK
jgi:cytidylate kinase